MCAAGLAMDHLINICAVVLHRTLFYPRELLCTSENLFSLDLQHFAQGFLLPSHKLLVQLEYGCDAV